MHLLEFFFLNAHKNVSLYLWNIGTDNRLKPIDIVVLKKLTEVVNVVPVIAKSDSLTIEERIAFKHRVCSFSLFRLCTIVPLVPLVPYVGVYA